MQEGDWVEGWLGLYVRHLTTQILFSQTFFKSLSHSLHFPNPHPTDSAFYPKDFIRSSFEYSDPQILI
jgi:hypothetical protein